MSASFRYSVAVRCHCPGGQKCPRLWRADGSWNSRHGSAEVNARIPVSGGTWRLHWSGYPSKAGASGAGENVGQLLALAGTDARTRAAIGDMIRAAGKDSLPATADVRRNLGLGRDPGEPGMLTGEWMTTWLAAKRRTRRASSARGYEMHIRHWLEPVLGHLPLERVNAAHIEEVFARIGRFNAEIERQQATGRAMIEIEGDVRTQPRVIGASTQRRIFATARACFGAAVRQRRLLHNPCDGVDLAAGSPAGGKRWTAAETDTFLAATEGDALGLLYRLAVLCGMRRGELCGLRWADTDLDAGVLEIRHTLLEVGGQVMDGEPKTSAGQRLVYLDTRDNADWTSTATRLRRHLQAQRKARLRAGADWADHDLVFARFDGTPWRPSYVTRQFRALAAQAGVPVIRLHDTRHTANSLMQEVGVPQEMRMRMVGHAGKGVNDGYTHPLAEAHRQVTELLVAHVRQAGGTR